VKCWVINAAINSKQNGFLLPPFHVDFFFMMNQEIFPVHYEPLSLRIFGAFFMHADIIKNHLPLESFNYSFFATSSSESKLLLVLSSYVERDRILNSTTQNKPGCVAIRQSHHTKSYLYLKISLGKHHSYAKQDFKIKLSS
jgi:hypothetical protein